MYRALTTDFESLPQLLAARAGEIGEERFVRDANQEWTYAEFHDRVRHMDARSHARSACLIRRTSIHQQTTAFGNPNRGAAVVANRTGVAACVQE